MVSNSFSVNLLINSSLQLYQISWWILVLHKFDLYVVTFSHKLFGMTASMRRALITDRIHVGKTLIELYASFLPHLKSVVAPLIHMRSSCPGHDTMSEAKSAPVHPITEPLGYGNHTTHASLSWSLLQADGALKPHCLNHKPQPGCTVQ